MTDYTPSADFDFSGLGAYSPTADFDFSEQEGDGTVNLALNQAWSLTAPEYVAAPLDQAWALTAPATGDITLNQSWALAIFTYLDVAMDQAWALAAPRFDNVHQNAQWALAAPTFASVRADGLWALSVPTFVDARHDQVWSLAAPKFASLPHDQAWALVAPFGGAVPLDQSWRLEATAVWSKVISATAYLFALEQGENRAEVPIANFSMQLRSGEPSYLQASIPNAWAHAETVAAYAAHADSEMVINAGYRWSDDSYTTQEIARVTLRNVRYDYGSRSAGVSLDGTDTRTNATPASHMLTGASYLNQDSDGRLRYRVTPNFAVRPGDTVTVGNDTFIVGELSYQVSASAASMEVAGLVEA